MIESAAHRDQEEVESEGATPIPSPMPLPSLASLSHLPRQLLPIGLDPRGHLGAIRVLKKRADLTTAEIARRMGLKPTTVYKYFETASPRPSLRWLVRFAHACGGRVLVELPAKDRREYDSGSHRRDR